MNILKKWWNQFSRKKKMQAREFCNKSKKTAMNDYGKAQSDLECVLVGRGHSTVTIMIRSRVMGEQELFADWKNQSNSVNPWLAWQARADIAKQRISELRTALSELACWAKDIAGDCDDPIQRQQEDEMMERINKILEKNDE